MKAWEISYKIKYDYPFIKMSEKYPGTRVSMWCVWDREMVHVPLTHEGLMDELQSYTESINRYIDGYKNTNEGIVLTLKCSCDILDSMWNIAERNGCSSIQPASFLDGWGYFKVISFSEENTRRLFSELTSIGTTELISKRVVKIDALPSTIWVETFFEKMTDKQMDALIKAVDYGYYSSPREVTTDSIATSLGVSRSTYEEHLRKAENKIMESIAPYLKLFKAGGRKPEEVVSAEIDLVKV